ncbi:MAG: helix-turn-helix domain-containing protein [Sulfobacillus sp.]
MTWTDMLDAASARGSTAQALGRRIRRLRRERDLSQRLLGSLVGVDGSTVAHWELGSRLPSAEALRRCAAVLGSTPLFLVAGRDDGPHQHESVLQELGELFGVSSASDSIQEWPPAMVQAFDAWATFTTAPTAENLEAMVATLPAADARIAAALRVIRSGRPKIVAWYLHATDAMLDAVEDTVWRIDDAHDHHGTP